MTLLLAALLLVSPPPAEPWTTVAPGLEVARFRSARPAAVGDSTVLAVRIDPVAHAFRLLSAKLLSLPKNLTAPEWVEREGVLGVINASMFQGDQRTSLAYMRDGAGINNAVWSKDNAVFASGPLAPGLPPTQILDRTCQDGDGLARQYRLLVQNIRMLDCQRRNTWAQQPRRWSTAAVGTDGDGRVLFLHARSAWSTHDLIDVLLSLPLDLSRLMYVEGGPEASLYVKVGGRVVASEVGSYETGFWENDGNALFWPLPNVLAFEASPAGGSSPPSAMK